MPNVVRFSVSLEKKLLGQFDAFLRSRRYTNRSEGVRDLIREALIERDWQKGDTSAAGVVTLLYDHSAMDLPQRLTRLQHHEHTQIISTLHVHLDEQHCLEVLVLKGMARDLRDLADRLISTRGVKHGKLTMTATGESL